MSGFGDEFHQSKAISRAEQHRIVETYYRETDFDYRAVWRSERTRARHFGFHYNGPFDHRHAVARASADLAGTAAISEGTRVLDCGCGLGGTALWLAQKCGALVTGIDLLEHQVASAISAVRRLGLASQARFLCGDAADTGLPDASFDVVLIQEALCHLPDKRAFYAEARRLLAPGGRLVVAEYMRRAGSISDEHESILQRWCLGWAMPQLWTQEEHADAARRAGFADVTILNESAAVNASLRSLHRCCLLLGPLNSVLCAVGLRSEPTQANIAASRLQYEAFREGLWMYGKMLALEGN
jgi:ubiquinone/menaquinone biosynthesis C-methylase UbiE